MVKVQFLRNAYTATSDEHFLTTSTYPPPEPSTQSRRNKPATATNNTNNPLIQSVLDVLPDLNRDFVTRLLERYANNTEQAIAAVLEGNLPPDLQPTDPAAAADNSSSLPIKNPKPSDPFGFGDAAGVIVKRNKGFPGQARNLATLLDDKTHVRQLRDRYHEWGLIAEAPTDEDGAPLPTTGATGSKYNEYDDEYDDSYDALADTERRGGGGGGGGGSRRAIAVRNPNRAVFDELRDDVEDDDDEDEDDEEEEEDINAQAATSSRGGAAGSSSYYDRSKNFCENPEVARERRAQQWNNKCAARQPQQH